MRRNLWLMLTIFCRAFPASPEVIEFKNADRLTGNWQRVVDGKLLLKTENLGDVVVPLDKIKAFEAAKPAVMMLKDGQQYQGQVCLLESGEWELTAQDTVKRIPSAAVLAIYPAEVYRPSVEERPHQPWRNWKGTSNIGYSLAQGDRKSGTLSVGLAATRRRPGLPGLSERLRTHYFLSMLFANTRDISGLKITSNNFSSGLRQDFLFTPYNFIFVLGQADHDAAQSLKLRQTYGAGLGRDLVHMPALDFQFLGGLTYVKERFEVPAPRKNSEGLLGEKLSFRLTRHVGFQHFLNYYPSLTKGGGYRFDTTSTLSTHITSRLSFNTSLTDRYLSRPLPGRVNNELIVTTGLGLNF